MDQVLLSDKYKFFPQQKRLNAKNYDNIKLNYERVDQVKKVLQDRMCTSAVSTRNVSTTHNNTSRMKDVLLQLESSFEM